MSKRTFVDVLAAAHPRQMDGVANDAIHAAIRRFGGQIPAQPFIGAEAAAETDIATILRRRLAETLP